MSNQSEALKLLSMEELLKRKASIRRVIIGSSISTAILLGILMYLIILKDNYVLLVAAICLPVSVLPSLIARKNIHNEIAERSSVV